MLNAKTHKKSKRIIVVGAGFAGCMAAKSLAKQGFEVLIFDKRNHHVFQPLLYQVATSMLSPAQISHPIRAMFRKYKNVRVLIGNIQDIDKEKKVIRAKRSNQAFSYDYLIMAVGARHAYFGHPEWEKYAWGLKTNKDALKIRERMLYSFEKAERTRFEKKRQRYSTFVIVGAGPTGVEMAGAIAELTQNTLVKDFREFKSKCSRVILIEGSDRVLNRYAESLSEKAKSDLKKLGVEIRLNAFVTNVSKDGVYVGDEFIETENIIWAAGNIASPVIAKLTKHTNSMGQALVNSDFSIKEDKGIFCAGDCAYLKDSKGIVVPAVAPAALQAGAFIAKQILNDANGKPRDSFCYLDKGSMATIGRSRAIAQIGSAKFSGFFAWFLWCVVHVLFLIGFRSKSLVILDWMGSYFTNKRSVRLINNFRAGKDKDS